MPELPEVETISRYLNDKIPGLTIRDFWTDFSEGKKVTQSKSAIRNIPYPTTLARFKKQIIGKKILRVRRKGKNILFDLSGDKLLVVHQKMTGHFLVGRWRIIKNHVEGVSSGLLGEKVNSYIHAMFDLSDGTQLALSDLRKFAKLMAGDRRMIEDISGLKDLGPDALNISKKEFVYILKNKKGKIKQVLMDQNVIAGIGNIYSDEILWFAKIHPFVRVEKLSKGDIGKLYKFTRQILKEAVRLRGTSISDYRDPEGKSGGYDKIRRVYRREGLECPHCQTPIKRIKMGGRSAHFCPQCQKMI